MTNAATVMPGHSSAITPNTTAKMPRHNRTLGELRMVITSLLDGGLGPVVAVRPAGRQVWPAHWQRAPCCPCTVMTGFSLDSEARALLSGRNPSTDCTAFAIGECTDSRRPRTVGCRYGCGSCGDVSFGRIGRGSRLGSVCVFIGSAQRLGDGISSPDRAWGDVVISLVEALEAKERAAAEQVAGLREQLESPTGQVVVAEALVVHYHEARETVCEVLAEAPNPRSLPRAVRTPLDRCRARAAPLVRRTFAVGVLGRTLLACQYPGLAGCSLRQSPLIRHDRSGNDCSCRRDGHHS